MNPPSPPPGKKFSWPLAFTVIALLLAALATLVFLRLESWPARSAQQGAAELERLGRKVRDAFVQIANLQPQITINDRVYLEQTTPIAELAMLSRQIEVEHEFQHTWAGSTKRVKLHASFAVKAGFDLRQDFRVDLRDDRIMLQLPRGAILGVEQQQVEVLAYENGLWNRISAEDLQSELAALPLLARDKASQSGLAGEAELALRQQLEERIPADRPMEFIFSAAPPMGSTGVRNHF